MRTLEKVTDIFLGIRLTFEIVKSKIRNLKRLRKNAELIHLFKKEVDVTDILK